MTIERVNFLGVPLDTGVKLTDICLLLRARDALRLITFINPQAWALVRKFPAYLNALNSMSLVLPDGESVASACRILTKRECPRISFDMTSLADPFFRAAIAENATLMLVGGKPGVDEDVHIKLHQAYPELKIVGTLHGYGDFTTKVSMIMEVNPDAVIVGMGSPRQEEFLLALRDAGYRGLAITCGGFLDQYLEADNYYPNWINKYNLRFAWRLYKEPRRLWKRYLIDYQFFIWKTGAAFVETYTPSPIKALAVKAYQKWKARKA